MAALLEVQGLNAWYGESHILHGVDMRVAEGETITILGRNGVGKTTTLRTITGIVRTRKGKISFAGSDMMQVPLHKTARRGIGFVPEERGIFSTLTVSENLLLPPVVAEGGMTLDEIYELFPNLYERRGSRAPNCQAANSRCWRSPESCAPASGCSFSTNRRKGLPRDRPAHRRGAEDPEGARHDDPARRAEFPFRQSYCRSLLSDGSWADGGGIPGW